MNTIDLRTLRNDKIILQKIKNNKDYEQSLKEVSNICKTLDINCESIYYQYQLVLKQLEGFNYFEATFFMRINNEDYLKLLSNLSK